MNNIKAQYTAIPDPIFEEYLIDFGIDSDGIINGQVLTSDINFRIDLQINESPPFYFINDFTGIEDFTALETIFFAGTNVTEIDFSNLNNLSYIEGISNSDLVSIDLSGCENLESFIMSGTSLSSLNLPHNADVRQFFSTGGLLTELDVSSYPNLNGLSVHNNSLQTLNIANGNNSNFTFFRATNNPNLKCIIVDDTDYSNANWVNIDPISTFVGTEEECDALLSVNESTFINFKMYPNPSSDFFQVTISSEITKVQIIDLNGKIVKSFSNVLDQYPINELSKGFYIVSIQTNEGRISKKLIVQ
ncbi:T9SS type A sorting domain-containing protein [uncultured Dokdonia sp.]|uniref:T9SS type A sorting domain-containing protein n=1 Tax=uncultured Dokdonia sp. TaxID=575653 RepID=UPI0026144232|nr:T9SS type A sorting domain-containing protein [uncultured Dokdonia sp.]